MMKTVVKDYLDNNKLDGWQERENPKKAAQQYKLYLLSWEKEKSCYGQKIWGGFMVGMEIDLSLERRKGDWEGDKRVILRWETFTNCYLAMLKKK